LILKNNNNKTYGLGKERQLKNILLSSTKLSLSSRLTGLDWLLGTVPPSCVTRARGSFGAFDIQSFHHDHCALISVKSVRADYWSCNSEVKKLSNIDVPDYCKKYLVIWWSRNPARVDKYGWEVIHVD